MESIVTHQWDGAPSSVGARAGRMGGIGSPGNTYAEVFSLLRTVTATRYVTPLREGGSLPAIVEADDLGTYVLKFRGAGQGPQALVAEVIGAGVARALGLAVPELVLVGLDPVLGRNEPDHEIRSHIKASAGVNLGVDYL